MSYNLVVVESPNKIKHIKQYLIDLYPSEKWEVAASVGHFAELSNESGNGFVTAGVMENTYLTDMVISKDKQDVFKKLKALAKDADKVYLATDSDREGEAIADNLKTFLRLKTPIRVLFNEITKSGIKSAMDNPAGELDANLVVAQRARRVLDRLVGFLVSPELYRLMGVHSVSAGRVQSPVLRLIYERAYAISNFKPNDFFDVFLTCESEGKSFKAKLKSKPLEDDNGYFTDKNLALEIANFKELSLVEFKESERLKNPSSPLTTSLMQQIASGVLKIKPKQAMQAAQSLFEAGLITYHRTDNPNLSEETYNLIKDTFSDLGVMPEQRVFVSKEGAQEGHPAITPTDLSLEVAGASDIEKNIYALIRTYAIASQLMPAKYKVRTALFKAENSNNEFEFTSSGSELIDSGYLSFVNDSKETENEDEDEDAQSALLPDLNNGFSVLAGECVSKQTKPPKIYTVKSLLSKLESLGIGRPATIDGIFENLERKEYIIIDNKNNMTPTILGEKVLMRLIDKFEFIEYKFTSDMEKELDLIASGKADYVKVVHGFYLKLYEQIQKLKEQKSDIETFSCPDCSSPLKNLVKKGSYDFFACTNRENCKYSADNVDGKPVERKKAELSEHKCPKCEKHLVHRVKANSYDFWGCSGHPECDYSADNKDGVPVARPVPPAAEHHCPECSKPLARRTGKSAKGAYDFWGCTGFRDGCKKSFNVAADGSPVFDK